MNEFCKPCAERGRPGVLAHRIVNGEGMCAECFGGCSTKRLVAAAPRSGLPLKEKPVSERKCSECGNKLHHLVKGGVCRKCRDGASGNSRARGGKKTRRPNSYGRHSPSGGTTGGLTLTVPATDELCQQRWDELTLKEKVQLLNSRSEESA